MVELSIIIVNYKVKEELFLCIESIMRSKTKTPFEIIIVDNDEIQSLKKDLEGKFPKVKYFHSSNNVGFGGGNNIGAKLARGKYLYFLNPDTEIFPGSIDPLINSLKINNNLAVAAPILVDEEGGTIPLQGTNTLTPIAAILSFSILSRFFSKNKFSNNFWISGWNRKTKRKVKSVPGTAFIIKKSIFEEVEGFDENFFLYFEEYDLCKRISDKGYDLLIVPEARVFHKKGKSTEKRKKESMDNIFSKSRFYYFRKNFGLLKALIVSLIFGINKNNIILLSIILFGFALRLYKLSDLMVFIGDQGWFYLSARDLILGKNFPLVGIASSHPWLHQGALWTYMLAPTLWLGKFNPVSGAYLTAILGVISIYLIYLFCRENFTKRVALITALLYASSPYIVIQDRTPYHTSPIPLFTILYLVFITKWIKGKILYFPLIFFTFSILYGLEIAALILLPSLVLMFFYGFYKKTEWFKNIVNGKILIASIGLLLIPLIPILIYDIQNGFSQTVKFIIWLGYRFFVTIGLIQKSPLEHSSFENTLFFFFDAYRKLVFIQSFAFSELLLFSSFLFAALKLVSSIGKKLTNKALIVIFTTTVISFIFFVVNKVPSDAYIPVMYPGIVILLALIIDSIFYKWKMFGLFIVFFLVFSNVNYLIKSDFLTSKKTNTYSTTLKERIDISKKMVDEAKGKRYSVKMLGFGSQFESSKMNYQYLTWWLGNELSNKNQKLNFTIDETGNGIILKKDMLR